MVTEAIAPSRPAVATRPLTVAVVGATGLVGRTMIAVLGERGFPVGTLRPLASRADGRTVSFAGREWPVEVATPEAFAGVDDYSGPNGRGLRARFALDGVRTSEGEWGC